MLTKLEHTEMLRLSTKCLDPKDYETPLPDADKKDLKRLGELLKKLSGEPDTDTRPRPVVIRNYVPSPLCKSMIADGAEFQGVEQRNHGTEAQPDLVIREWLYQGAGSGRRAIFLQYRLGHASDARAIEAGRTIAAAAYTRFQR